MTFTPEQAHKIGEAIGIDWDEVEFDSEALAVGMAVELEHGTELSEDVNVTDDDPELTAKIAWAHLMESPAYYDLLAETKEQFSEMNETERERAGCQAGRSKRAYQIQLDTSKKRDKPPLSPEMDQFTKQYITQLEQAVKSGTPADDAFKTIMPNLDELSPDDLVNLLWENKHLGGRGSLQRFRDLLPALDIFDMIQKLLERSIWEAAVLWWSTQKTEKQRTPEEQEAAEQRDETETVVQRPKQKTSSFVYRGCLYHQLPPTKTGAYESKPG